MKNGSIRFVQHTKDAITHSYINWLLLFVPAGIAVNFAKLNPAVIFALNAVAIVPLAGLLAHATESVADRLGDTMSESFSRIRDVVQPGANVCQVLSSMYPSETRSN
jgi:hypothetical protein